jgi:hypothetical protein
VTTFSLHFCGIAFLIDGRLGLHNGSHWFESFKIDIHTIKIPPWMPPLRFDCVLPSALYKSLCCCLHLSHCQQTRCRDPLALIEALPSLDLREFIKDRLTLVRLEH